VLSGRQPVVYLRSFSDDRPAARLNGGRTEEEHLAAVLEPVGPFVAVGRPGEPLPELGARRMYLKDAEWKDVVERLIRSAKLVVIRTGNGPGLRTLDRDGTGGDGRQLDLPGGCIAFGRNR